MPVYRGAEKIAPKRPGAPLSRVYRGANLVYTSVPPVTPLSLGAISWFPFDGDYLDHGNNAAPWSTSGTMDISGGFLADGSLQPVYNGGFAFNPSAGASISAWAKRINPLNSPSAFAQVSASFSEIRLTLTSNGSQAFPWVSFRRGATAAVQYTTGFSGSPMNTWAHYVATMKPESGNVWRVRLWRDGVSLLNTTQNMGNPQSITFNGGRIDGGSTNESDDVSFFNRALTQEEVLALFAAGRN